jgi:hypothetical protein
MLVKLISIVSRSTAEYCSIVPSYVDNTKTTFTRHLCVLLTECPSWHQPLTSVRWLEFWVLIIVFW